MANVPVHEWNLLEAASRVRAMEVSSRELTGALLARIEALDPKVHAYITVLPEAAAAQAAACDEEQAKGALRGPFHGVPIGLKDIFCTAACAPPAAPGSCATSSPLRRHRRGEAPAAGAVVPGKTTWTSSRWAPRRRPPSSAPTRNPWDLSRIPGGSSGGSAAAVAAALCIAALGTDTGGSIRQPAALCGVVGMKPTYGRVSRYGLIAFASSLDQIGPFTRTVETRQRCLTSIAGYDPRDSTSASEEPCPTTCRSGPAGRGAGASAFPKEYLRGRLDSRGRGGGARRR